MSNRQKHYKFRRGRGYSVAADVVGDELERIWAENGNELRPADIVEEARPEGAPLHPLFEWDDEKAAEEHRLLQARQLVRSVRVVAEGSTNTTPAFVSVVVMREEKPQRHYQNIDVILDRPEEYQSALMELKKKLLQITESFEELKALAKKQAAPNGELAKITAIVEALYTARSLSEHLN